MEGSYTPLSNLNTNQSRQNSDNNLLLNNPHAPKATNKARGNKFNLGLFSRTIVRWFVTATLISLVIATLRHYQKKGNFPLHQKRNFNAIITAEILCLGLNFSVSRKVHAQENT